MLEWYFLLRSWEDISYELLDDTHVRKGVHQLASVPLWSLESCLFLLIFEKYIVKYF